MAGVRVRGAPSILLAALAAALMLPAGAAADDGGGGSEVRRTRRCTGSSEATLRLRAKEGVIRVELELDTEQRGSRWSVILLHERRIVFRGALRAGRSSSLRLRRSVSDWFGKDTVVARATGPRAEVCRVSASL
jgi:hypothetical protein